MPDSKQSRFCEIKIHKFSNKGHGIGTFQHVNGNYAEVEVAFALPGDLLTVELLGKKRGQWVGKIHEIIKPSEHRISPQCAHFGSCGGCRWQQMHYDDQLRIKETTVKNIFKSIVSPEVEIRPIMGFTPEWQYRNKMEFTFSTDLNKNKYLGLIKDSSKGKVLNLFECHLVNTWYIEILHAVKEWWDESNLDAYHLASNKGSLRTLILREGINTGERMIILTVSGNVEFALKQPEIDNFVESIRKKIPTKLFENRVSIILRTQYVAKGVPTHFYEMLLFGKNTIREKLHVQVNPDEPPTIFNFAISPMSFFQPNTKQAERFYSLALQLAKIDKNSVVYDLYCGTGTLGICSSKIAKQVIGIEISPEAAEDARTNALLNNCENVAIYAGAVRHVLTQIQTKDKIPPPDIVLVDPPRVGLDPIAMRHLLSLNSPTILSISCNPHAQALNVIELMQNGYEVKVIQPIDQFPQTIHIENVILLHKKRSCPL